MQPSDDGSCKTLIAELYELANAMEQAAELLQRCLTDPIGAKARLQRARDYLTKGQEKLDSLDSRTGGLLRRLNKCHHPREANRLVEGAAWSCDWCGEVWSGLQWQSHRDKAEKE